MSLRLVVFDRTQYLRRPPGLGLSWAVGTRLYTGLGRIDGAYGASSLADAFHWLLSFRPEQPISELQYWGHGRWGRILIDKESLDRGALGKTHRLYGWLAALRERLAPDALVWFRTCETLGARPGQDFAQALGDFWGARIAGHTYIVAFFQSGLHVLRPGLTPHWAAAEGLARGTPEAPEAALRSTPCAPNTITCLTGQIPEAFSTT